MKKVLLTGANGYIGSHLASAILKNGYELATLTRRPFPVSNTENKILAEYDVDALGELLLGQDVVIHLAAIAHQAGAESPEGLAFLKKINVENTLVLASAAKAAGVKRFIFMSSIKAMGESTVGSPFRSSDKPNPEDAYGRSKLEAEKRLHEILDESATDLVVIRPPLVWGGAMKGNLAMLQRLIAWRIPLPLGAIDNKRDLVSIDNLCDLICTVVEHPGAPGNTFLVSDGTARTTAQIAQLMVPEKTTVRLFHCPKSLLQAATKLPFIGASVSKLIGNLEVDIESTQQLLQWVPKKG